MSIARSWKKTWGGPKQQAMLLAVLLLGFVLPWVGFVLLAQKVWTGGFASDNAILKLLYRNASPTLDALAVALANIGDSEPMIALGVVVAAVLARLRYWRQAGVFVLAVGGSMLLTQVLKAHFARPRPDLWVSIKPALTFSFPSGHAMDTAALATAVTFLLWQHRVHWLAWPWLPLFALAVGWSRMYLGVHFPSDVLAGWLSAIGWVTGVFLLFAPAFRFYGAEQGPEQVSPLK
ncbi:phosphatase PAP2 family protein [Hymenobacter sp. BT683]|uniref:Phosphatase PAP2 family protein n=1 Tax=Hymenobacter jeongseonensis TaxID=2791027 RepID=A0ABS0IIB0_9BACT|nr:phosphatase PAP2 family protein [Hymenobacter jeongseonensis]MBF9238109.1 phosphatase PAP2 family protein [Hymenobacter jeongseonensis]